MANEPLHSFGSRWSWYDGVDRHACACRGFRQTARQRELHGLRHSIVDHLNGNIDGGFARDKNDPAPILRLHLREVMAAQAHAAHEIGFDDRRPVLIQHILKGLYFIDAKVIDQHVHARKTAGSLLHRFAFAQITDERLQLAVRMLLPDFLDRFGDTLL